MTAFVLQEGKQAYITAAGLPANGWKLFTYDTGTLNPRTTWLDSGQVTPNANPIVMDARGECVVFWSGTYRVRLEDNLGNTIWGPIDGLSVIDPTATLLTDLATFNSASKGAGMIGFGPAVTYLPNTVGSFLNSIYGRTPGEITAGVTPTNYYKPPGNVDRYGTNSVPGTTDMAAAFNSAFAVARVFDVEVTWGDTAPYRLNSPINCTGLRGTVVRDTSSRNVAAGAVAIIIAHDGATSSHGFDLSDSNETCWYNVTASSLAGKEPNSLWFIARNSVGSGCEYHRFFKCRTTTTATFKSVFYTYGSESCVYDDCEIYNARAASPLFTHTATNIDGYTSSFITIATGSQSNVCHHHLNPHYFNLGAGNTSVFNLERASNFTAYGGLIFLAGGKAFCVVSGNQPTNFFSWENVRAEVGGTGATNGIWVQTTGTTGANTNNFWKISGFAGITLAGGGFLVRFDDGAEIQNLFMNNVSATTGNVLSVFNMTQSTVDYKTSVVQGRAGGVVSNNLFIGNYANLTLSGTDTANSFDDTASGEYRITSDRFDSPSTACTGAITTAVIWKVRKTPNGRTATLQLPSTTGVATAVASFTYGVAIPAAFRPAADVRFPLIIQDNGNVLNQMGFVNIVAATGVMTVFKDLVGTANFTAAAGAGIPTSQSITWDL